MSDQPMVSVAPRDRERSDQTLMDGSDEGVVLLRGGGAADLDEAYRHAGLLLEG